MNRWFAPAEDGTDPDDADIAFVLEEDGLVADFVEDARQWWTELAHLRRLAQVARQLVNEEGDKKRASSVELRFMDELEGYEAYVLGKKK